MPDLPQRKRLRHKDFDYSTPGSYFLTIVVQGRLPLLGQLGDQGCFLSAAGQMVESHLNLVCEYFPGVMIDCSVIMPDHIHVIVVLGTDPEIPADVSISQIVHWLKSMTTARYASGVHDLGWPRFNGRLWQTHYHDEILRNQRALESRREYINANPFVP